MSDQIIKEHVTTCGAAYKSQTQFFSKQKKMIKYNIWDTAGQERFHSMVRVFYRDAGAIIFVYSITNYDTFNSLKKYWLPEIQKECDSNIILCVAANKSDLFDDEQVKEEEGRAFAESFNAPFISTSAFTRKGIDDLFQSIGEIFIKRSEQDNSQEPPRLSILINNDNDNEDRTVKSTKNKKKCC